MTHFSVFNSFSDNIEVSGTEEEAPHSVTLLRNDFTTVAALTWD